MTFVEWRQDVAERAVSYHPSHGDGYGSRFAQTPGQRVMIDRGAGLRCRARDVDWGYSYLDAMMFELAKGGS